MLSFVHFVVFRLMLFLGCLGVVFVNCEIPLLSEKASTMLEEGKRQYNLVKAKSTIPSLGSCWKRAVSHLHNGCKHLDDRTQSDMALKFANCFLEGAGISRYDCDDSSETEVCMKSMPDRAFMAYTEFFTHTQSMCFFIMSQQWHQETEETIDRLSVSAADVARQLEASEELQTELLNHQRQSVAIQQKLLDNGLSLDQMLHESKDSLALIFHEFRSSTLEQQRLLGMVFHHLSALQSWVVGEVSWIDSIAFYIPSFAFVFFITSAQRSSNARIPSYLLLIVAALTERVIAHILLQADSNHGNFQPVEIVNERLNWWVWLIRRSSVFGICVVLVIILYRYHDREEIMHQLLQQIQNQNEELLKYIRFQRTPSEIQLPTESTKMDETDGFRYFAIPTISPPKLVACVHRTSSSSSESDHQIISTSNGDIHSVRTEDSPISNSSFTNIQIGYGFSGHNARLSPALEEPNVERIQVEDIEQKSTSLIHSTPTPKRKYVRKPLYDKSPASPRYNLRRGRLSSPVT